MNPELVRFFFAGIFLQLIFLMIMVYSLRNRVRKLETLVNVLLRSPH